MSFIELSRAKEFLDVIHSADDAKLQDLLNAAEDEAVQYMGRGLLASGETDPAPSVVLGVMLLLQAAYHASPNDMTTLRRAAEVKLAPHRVTWGA